MNVKDILNNNVLKDGDVVEVSGWILDRFDGLFILNDHFPLDYDFPEKIKIINGNIMYAVLKNVSTLVGGRSKLFYRVKAVGHLVKRHALGIVVDDLFIQDDRGEERLFPVKIDQSELCEIVERYGDYKFESQKPSARDWLDD